MDIAATFNVVLGTIIAFTIVGGMWKYDRVLSWALKLALGSFASIMLLSTPAIFFNTPFDPWAFNMARFLLVIIFIEGFRLLSKWEKLLLRM